ncbi:MAG: hypothetical protein QOE06_1183 [Thermoleophilaceae bacterium]|nr:hypothetical protein [Thermoleophilaceae bacterium]
MIRTASAAEVVVELAPHPRSGQVAREAVEALAGQLHPETLAKVRLLVTEMVVAALAPAQDHPLCLTVRVTDGTVRAELRPAAPGADLAVTPRPRSWNLFLVNRIADRWEAGDALMWFEVDPRRFEPRRRG